MKVTSLVAQLKSDVPNLTLNNAEELATTTVEFFAENGAITVPGTMTKTKGHIFWRSAPGTEFSFGYGTTSESGQHRSEPAGGARITGRGGAEIRQEDDGSITYRT